MTAYYCDIGAPAAWNGRDGTDNTTNCWLGISGLQKAFDSVTAGNILYIKGTGLADKFYNVAYDADNDTSLTDGEEVTWGVDATHGHGVVHIDSTTATSPGTVQIEVISGVAPANDLDITGVTSGGVITPTATIAIKTINIDTQTGTNAAGYIKYIGVNASWTVDGTRAIIDGESNANGTDLLTTAAATDYLWFENIEAKRAGGSVKSGWNLSALSTEADVFINCCGHTNSGSGFYSAGVTYGTFYRCVAYSNTTSGWRGTSTGTRIIFCTAKDNTTTGFTEMGYNSPVIGCIAYSNSDGMTLTEGQTFINCVIHNNDDDGVVQIPHTASKQSVLLGNRITNHTTSGGFGLDCGGDVVIAGFNYFEQASDGVNVKTDTDDLLYGIPLENSSTDSNTYADDGTDTNFGYVNATTDFSTNYVDATDPTLRRTAITIPVA